MSLYAKILLVIISFMWGGISYAVDVQEEQQKIKTAIEKAKKPVETAKEILPSVPNIRSDQKATTQQQGGQSSASTPQQTQAEVIEYFYLGKRDPFMPLIKQETDKKKP
ncbi:MAG: hypothetical protein SNJ53_06735, partial [Thermodesulfovibrionales bacterium]